MRRRHPVVLVLVASAVLAAGCTHGHAKTSSAPTTSPPSIATTSSSGPPAANVASAPGVTAGQIVVGTHQPLTGPLAAAASEIGPAVSAYFSYVNQHGGVHGRSMVLKTVDDRGDPSAASDAIHDLVGGGVLAIVDGAGVAPHQAVATYLAAQHVPDLFIGAPCTCWNAPTRAPLRFGFAPDFTVEGAVLGDYIARVGAGQKVGYLVPTDASGADATVGLDRHVAQTAVVSRQTFDPGAGLSKVKGEIAALQQAGAQVVALFSPPLITAEALLAAADAGYRPLWVVSSTGSDPTTVTAMLQALSAGTAGGSLLEGVVTDTYLAPADDATNPWTQLWRKVHDAYIPKLPFDGNIAYGMAVAYTFVAAAQAAGQNPTQASIVAAVEHSPLNGPGLVPLAFGPTSHSGFTGAEVTTIVLGRLKPAASPVTVDAAGALHPVTAPPLVPPAGGIPAPPPG